MYVPSWHSLPDPGGILRGMMRLTILRCPSPVTTFQQPGSAPPLAQGTLFWGMPATTT
ncbi:hypothetical protein L209DRAFT_753721 [Thermothelomyces heterothallicus CBS 203.75]